MGRRGRRSGARGVKERCSISGRPTALGDAPGKAAYSSAKPLVLDTEMLETSSWGECGNDDLPGDQARFDKASLYFDSEPLPDDLDIFGYPTVALYACRRSADGVAFDTAVRAGAETQASHLVTYRFYNLAYRGGDMASPEKIEPGKTFTLRVPLNIAGHTFKKGWRIRLSLSPSSIRRCADRGRADRHAVRRRRRRLRGERPHAGRDASRGSRTRRCKSCCRQHR